MDIKKYLAALQAKEATQQVNFGKDADTVLGMLCSTYYELNCNADTDEAKQAFDNLYQANKAISPCPSGHGLMKYLRRRNDDGKVYSIRKTIKERKAED